MTSHSLARADTYRQSLYLEFASRGTLITRTLQCRRTTPSRTIYIEFVTFAAISYRIVNPPPRPPSSNKNLFEKETRQPRWRLLRNEIVVRKGKETPHDSLIVDKSIFLRLYLLRVSIADVRKIFLGVFEST